MRDYNKKFFLSLFWLVLGVVLIVLEIMGRIDGFWSGMGAALIGVAIVQIIRYARYKKDDSYKEKVDTAGRDERNRFIANKAWAWAGYCFVLICGVGSIALRIAGKEMLSAACAWAVCLMLVLYWVCYLIISKNSYCN